MVSVHVLGRGLKFVKHTRLPLVILDLNLHSLFTLPILCKISLPLTRDSSSLGKDAESLPSNSRNNFDCVKEETMWPIIRKISLKYESYNLPILFNVGLSPLHVWRISMNFAQRNKPSSPPPPPLPSSPHILSKKVLNSTKLILSIEERLVIKAMGYRTNVICLWSLTFFSLLRKWTEAIKHS